MQNKVALAWIVLLTFIVWFFSGQAYLKYQMRKALSEVSESFKNLWNMNLNDNSEAKKEVKTEVKKEAQIIKFSDSFTFKKSDSSEISLKVREVLDLGKTYKDYLYWEKTAQNNFFKVRFEAENIWKKEAFKSLSEYNIKLITADEFEYRATSVNQVTEDKPEWYNGCISCSMNPWEKSVEDIIFDIPAEKIKWAKIMLDENDNILFLVD